tara:strand:- start:9445 stop:10026 length:582 start_codon:yes stop_codon:yes gene_type:complete
MPNIITADELRQVLGVSESLFDDAYLNQIIESAEGVILPLLTQYQCAIVTTRIKNGVIFCETLRPCYFGVGQTIIIAGCGEAIDGEYEITSHSTRAFEFSVETLEADRGLYTIIPSGTATLDGYSAATLYANTPAIKSALLVVSTEIFQSITASGGQIEGVDFTPTPFRMGRSLMNRVIGLLSPFMDVDSMAQ